MPFLAHGNSFGTSHAPCPLPNLSLAIPQRLHFNAPMHGAQTHQARPKAVSATCLHRVMAME